MPTVAEHLRSPQVTIDRYVRDAQIALGKDLSSKHAVFLDTKFWILLRDANCSAGNDQAVDLLKLLRKGASEKKLFCPISEGIFIEILKQNESISSRATAQIVDELSLGVSLIPQEIRIKTEIAHFMHSHSRGADLLPLQYLIWSKLAYVMGFLHPYETVFDPETEKAIQKAFFDHMWSIQLTDMLAEIGNKSLEFDSSEIAKSLNLGCAANAHQIRSFRQAYSAEIRGIVDIFGGVAAEIMLESAKFDGIFLDRPTRVERLKCENAWKDVLAISLEKNKAQATLRTMHILASLHASLRWNRDQKFKTNDLLDFDHAASALSYCKAFFTEKPLGTMVRQKHIALDSLYGCSVATNLNDAIKIAADLSAEHGSV